jgi:hypothetical protein
LGMLERTGLNKSRRMVDGRVNSAAVGGSRSLDAGWRRGITTGREVFASFPDLKEQAADALRVGAEPL